MKKFIGFIVLVMTTCFQLRSQHTEGNPFARLGYKADVYTFGEKSEFHDREEVVEIGDVLFNTRTNEVVGFVKEDVDSLIELKPELQSMSIDPHCEKYYSITPYAYCFNNPVRFIDPDGKDSYEYDVLTRKLTRINDVGGKETQHVDFVKGDDFITNTSVNGENVYVYALKDAYAVTNYDAHFDDKNYNTNTGYEYSVDDFLMRKELMGGNPISSYIFDRERNHSAEPITRQDAEDTYGTSLMGLITLSRTIETALNLVDTGVGITPKFKINNSKSVLQPSTPTGNKNSNSWNSFLKANKGKYSGPNWIEKAAKDYYKSPFYKK